MAEVSMSLGRCDGGLRLGGLHLDHFVLSV